MYGYLPEQRWGGHDGAVSLAQVTRRFIKHVLDLWHRESVLQKRSDQSSLSPADTTREKQSGYISVYQLVSIKIFC